MNYVAQPVVLGSILAGLLMSPGAAAAVQDKGEDGRFLRVVEEPGETIGLEVAARRYARADGAGPEVCLVSVAHIGDAELYSRLQTLLDQFDVVLYESVKPAGAARPAGADDAQRAASTLESMRFVAGLVAGAELPTGSYPATLAEVATSLGNEDPRLAQWAQLAAQDAWGRPLEYAPVEDSFTLRSLGADGREGGEGANADLVISDADAPAANPLTGDDGLQAQLADALGLEFQLEAVDYSRAHFRCSDMTLDQLERELQERGIDFGELSGSLAGTSFSAKVVNGLLKLVKVADAVLGGRLSDVTKLVMIEVLGNEAITNTALNQQFGSGFAEVIVGSRNQIVMDDLAALLEAEPEVKSVAIFYGAAHMPDFEQRLAEQLDYHSTSAEWIPALTFDFNQSALTEAEIKQVRMMFKMSLARMMRDMK